MEDPTTFLQNLCQMTKGLIFLKGDTNWKSQRRFTSRAIARSVMLDFASQYFESIL